MIDYKQSNKNNSKTINKDLNTIYPLVAHSPIKNFSFDYFLILYIVLAWITTHDPKIWIIFLIIMIPLFIFLKMEQKNFIYNIKRWDVSKHEPQDVTIDKRTGEICVGGKVFSYEDIAEVKILYNNPPQMKGISSSILLMLFMNCTLVFVLKEHKSIEMHVQSKKCIKEIVNIFVSKDFQISFDQKIYKLCNLN